MTTKEIAEFFALLTILEPETITCKLIARLATAGTATDEATDIQVIKEIRQNAEQIAQELATVNQQLLDRKQALVAKYIEAATPATPAS